MADLQVYFYQSVVAMKLGTYLKKPKYMVDCHAVTMTFDEIWILWEASER